MPNEIKCPNCGHQFEPNEAIREEVQKELRVQMQEWRTKKEEEYTMQLEKEKLFTRTQVEETLRKSISADYENQLQLLKTSNADNEEKLKTARQRELEFLKKMQELQTKEAELDLELQKKLQQERQIISEQIRKQEAEKNTLKDNEYSLKLKELEKQLEDQKKLAEEMKRRAEQGSMQLQGEVQELLLEDVLRQSFPYDTVEEVVKGVKGADCMLVIRNQFGQDCGKIIFESKRTKDFSEKWIEKLKADMRSQSADIAVIVTQAMPKDFERFGQKDGVWICSFTEVKALTHVFRENIIRIAQAQKGQENKGEKMQMLYDYLTGNEFAEQWKAIREGFMNMKISIQKERDTMERLWKNREKQLEKVLLNAAHIHGSVEGIAGIDSINLQLLDPAEEDDDIEN